MTHIFKSGLIALAFIAATTVEKPAAAVEAKTVGAIACVAALSGAVVTELIHWWRGRQVRPELIALAAPNDLMAFESCYQDLQLCNWDAEFIVRDGQQGAFECNHAMLSELHKSVLGTHKNIERAIEASDPIAQESVSLQLLEYNNHYRALGIKLDSLQWRADSIKEVIQLKREFDSLYRTMAPLFENSALGKGSMSSYYIIGHALAHDVSVADCLSTLEQKCKRIGRIANRLYELRAHEFAATALHFAENAQQLLRVCWENENVIDALYKDRWIKIQDLKEQLARKEQQLQELRRGKARVQQLLDDATKEIEKLQRNIQYKEQHERELSNLRCEIEQLRARLERSQAEKERLEHQMHALSDEFPPVYAPSAPSEIVPPQYEPSAPAESMMV